MTISSSSIAKLRERFNWLTQLQIWREVLKCEEDIAIVAIDAEWWERMPHPITEVGIATLDTKDIRGLAPGANGENFFKHVGFFHYRIKENGHYENWRDIPHTADYFEFGNTRWVDKAECKEMLEKSVFARRSKANPQERMPVVFAGHALDNDFEKIKEELGVDLDAINTVVAKIDTQVLAAELGLSSAAKPMSLKNLTSHFGITPTFLHNAGNDIAYSMIDLIILGHYKTCAERREWFQANRHLRQVMSGLQEFSRPVQQIIEELKQFGQVNYHSSWGTGVFCARCEWYNHNMPECTAKVHCEKCWATGKSGPTSHLTSRCRRRHPELENAPVQQRVSTPRRSTLSVGGSRAVAGGWVEPQMNWTHHQSQFGLTPGWTTSA